MLYLVVQVVLAVLALSWPIDLITGAVDLQTGERDIALSGTPRTVYNVGRIWTIVIIVDVLWTAVTALRPSRRD